MKAKGGLAMKYFVLKPRGTDEYAEASRKALRAYATYIYSINTHLANDLLEWVRKETPRPMKSILRIDGR